MTRPSYVHHQFGKILTAVFLSVIGLLGLLMVLIPQPLLVSVFLSIMLTAFILLLLVFASFRVEVSRGHLKARFGLGLICKSLEMSEIVDAYPVRNKWYWGVGIRLTPHGWLYNVQGLDAVEIVMRSGTKYRIGSPEPDELTRALKSTVMATREPTQPFSA
jgi:hypothetical protein